MKKTDLKTGMKVITRNGGEYVVLLNTSNGDILRNIPSYTHMKLKDYTDDLEGINYSNFDIMEVYDSNDYDQLMYEKYNMVWKRKELKEMTIEEIQKELGYKIKIVE